jgi:hypothetical protein
VGVRAQEQAALSLRAHLRSGRLLRGWPLALAVALRDLPCAVLTVGESLSRPGVAPSWVVVEDRGSGEVVLRLPAGRAAGSGAWLLEQVRLELRTRTREEFLQARPG